MIMIENNLDITNVDEWRVKKWSLCNVMLHAILKEQVRDKRLSTSIRPHYVGKIEQKTIFLVLETHISYEC